MRQIHTNIAESRFAQKLAQSDRAEIEFYLQRLLADKGLVEAVLHSLDDGIVVTTPDLQLLLHNQRAEELLELRGRHERNRAGRPLGQLIGRADVVASLLDFDPGNPHPWRKTVEPAAETEAGPPGRNPVSLRLRFQPLRGANEAHTGWILSVEDRTDLRKVEQQKRQIEKMASLAVLTAGVAHEIKNPLNSLSIHAQLLSKRLEQAAEEGEASDPRDYLESVQIILEETQRLGGVVEEFLQAARPTHPSLEPRNPNDICRQVADLMGPQCEREDIVLQLHLSPDIGRAQYDDRQMTQALVNLVKNSIEAIAEKREAERENEEKETLLSDPMKLQATAHTQNPDRIIIRTKGLADKIVFSVEDTGPGISEENLRQIFEPYFTTKFHGTGLGLMNVFRIIQEHEGNIDLRSQPGEGATFTLTIPRKAPPPMKQLPAGDGPNTQGGLLTVESSGNE